MGAVRPYNTQERPTYEMNTSRADVLGVTHRLPPLAPDLCTGAASVSARRRSPVSAADPTARAASASTGAVRKKGQNFYMYFFLHITKGNGGPVAGVGGTKMFGGGFKKGEKIPPPTLTPQPPHSQTARLSASLTKPPPQNTPPHHSQAENATQQITCDACMLGCTIFKTHRITLDETLIKSCPSLSGRRALLFL